MTCRDFADFLLEYVEGTLPADARQRFDDHLGICPDCVRYLEQYRDTIVAGRLALTDALPDDIPDSLISAILHARREP